MNYFSDTLYKVDSKGKVRTFQLEVEDEKYRMISGLEDGKKTTTKWTVCKAKNVGRANATTPEKQADLEAAARLKKKLEEHYYVSRDEAIANPDAFFKVMLATDVDKVKPPPEFPLLLDPKLDGMRLVENAKYSLSRRGKPVPAAKWIHEELLPFLQENPTITLDGELYNHDYREDFNTLMSIARREKMDVNQALTAETKLQYHIYDMFDSSDPNMSAVDRKHKLSLLPIFSDRIKEVKFTKVSDSKTLEEVKGKHLTDGYEGSIIRTFDSVYEQKRSKNLIKIKQFITEEYKVLDITPGTGNRGDIAGRVFVKVGDVSVGCGIRGSWEYAYDLLENKYNFIGEMATVRHFGKTEDGSLRFPICIDLARPD
jgi:DNA ligase-1